jgi:hypothetical protein
MSYDAKQDSVKTPAYIKKWIRKKFGKFYDPVPYNPKFDPSKHKDALKTEWKAVNFINPPYSRASMFVKKEVEQWKQKKTCILLVKLDVLGRKAFREYRGCEIVFFPERVKFVGHATAPEFSVCLLIYRAGKRSTKYSFFS